MVAADGELAVALRERLDRAYVTVVDGAGGEILDVLAATRPWPWMVAGAVADLPASVREWLCARPVLLRWLGPVPPGLPRHCRTVAGFTALVESTAAALHAEIGGVRLAVGTGVAIDGTVHANAELEALLGEAPGPVDLPRSRVRSAGTLLARCAPHLCLQSSSAGTTLAGA